jgi:hypothetical protein
MSRLAALAVLTFALIGAALAAASTAAAEDEGVVYQRYADIRERLLACHLESKEGWDTATDAIKADCRRIRRDYVLYAWTGEGYTLHVHCRSPKRCIATPSSEPPADGPIPAGAAVYDVKISNAARRAKKRHHRRSKARSRRSRAARGSAAAVR